MLDEDEFLKPYLKLYIWKYHYDRLIFRDSDMYDTYMDEYMDEARIKKIILDRHVYNDLYDLVDNSEEVNTSMTMFRMSRHIKEKHEYLVKELFNPCCLKLETIDKIKNLENKDLAELLFVKAIIYVKIATRLLDPLSQSTDVAPYLWLIYLIRIYRKTIENKKYLHYFDDEYIDIKQWLLVF